MLFYHTKLLLLLDNVEVHDRNSTVEVRANHLLSVPGHNAFTRSEVFGSEDRRGDDEWDVRSVDVSSLQVAATLVTDEDLVPWEVRVLVDSEPVGQRSHRLSTEGERRSDLSIAVELVARLVED